MKEKVFTDINGEQLIVTHRKSAVFLERIADVKKENRYHPHLVSFDELCRTYRFSDEVFQEFCQYGRKIAQAAWKNFSPKEADSSRADYDDYYDREFDNNGSLSIRGNEIRIEGPTINPNPMENEFV